MITPDYASGHEVTHPIAVEGAEIGDSVCLKIKKINVLSLATTSGTDSFLEGNFVGDPFVAKQCPGCGLINPKTYLDGIGEDAIKCEACKTSVKPFHLDNGYTMLFNPERTMGVPFAPDVGGYCSTGSAIQRDSRGLMPVFIQSAGQG